MKKLFIILAILFIVFLIAFVSCKKVNILSPTRIPNPARIKITIPPNNNIIIKDVEVNPKPAKDGEVFGGFVKKFKYQNHWYILANKKYEYDAKTKSLNNKAINIILKIEDNGELTVYNENTDYKTWIHLNEMNIIETDKVSYNYNNSFELGSERYYYPYFHIDYMSYEDKINLNSWFYSSSDLLNWSDYLYTSLYTNLPKIKTGSWHRDFGLGYFKIFVFKGYLYVIGGSESIFETHPLGDRNINQPNLPANRKEYYRVSLDKDIEDGKNWETLSSSNYWEDRDSMTVKISYDNDKIYVYGGNRAYYKTGGGHFYIKGGNWYLSWYPVSDNKVWESSDGVNWKVVDNYNYYSDNNASLDKLPVNIETTPEEPDWINVNNTYYKTASQYEYINLNSKYYPIPIPPIEEIRNAINRGEKNFVITEEHIKNAGLNQFMLTTVNPTNASENDWKLIVPYKYSGDNMVWQIGSDNMLFNVNGKIILLADYSEVENFNMYGEYSRIISDLRKEAESYRNIGDYYEAMYHEAQVEMLDKILQNNDLIKPKDAISHYEIEFK